MTNQHGKPTTTLEFTLPRNSIFAWLPPSISPYIEITRMHILPINLVCFSPFAVGLAFAANATCLPWLDLVRRGAAAYVTALLAGCAGHTLDDCLDYDIDRKYERCQSRPLVRGDISLRNAFLYAMLLQALFLISVLQTYGAPSLSYGLACAVLFWVYPLCKRVWNFPQVVMGILHAIPIPWMASSLNIDPWGHDFTAATHNETTRKTVSLWAIYTAFAMCTILFDTGYGLLDAENDLKYAVGSMSVRFRSNLHTLMWSLGVILVSCLVIAGQASGLGWLYFAGCTTVAIHLAYLISRIDPSSAKSAIDFFMSVNALIPAEIILSLLADYVIELTYVDENEKLRLAIVPHIEREGDSRIAMHRRKKDSLHS